MVARIEGAAGCGFGECNGDGGRRSIAVAIHIDEKSFNDDLTEPATSDVFSATVLYAETVDCFMESSVLVTESGILKF